MTIRFIKDYIKHRITAKTRRGQQSPFIAQLLHHVIYDKSQPEVYTDIEKRKRTLIPQNRRKGNRPKADQLLYRLARHFKPAQVVEIGTGRGVSKHYLTRALPNAKIISLEHDGSLSHTCAKLPPIDFAFINYYNPDELYTCFQMLLPKLQAHSLLIICNIYGETAAKQNFQLVKEHPAVTATVDLFWLQLVFFRDGLDREHFKGRL